jgi:hypothetical protein
MSANSTHKNAGSPQHQGSDPVVRVPQSASTSSGRSVVFPQYLGEVLFSRNPPPPSFFLIFPHQFEGHRVSPMAMHQGKPPLNEGTQGGGKRAVLELGQLQVALGGFQRKLHTANPPVHSGTSAPLARRRERG